MALIQYWKKINDLCCIGNRHIILMAEVKAENSEYDEEIPQSQTADNPMAPRGRAAQPSRDTRKTAMLKTSM